MKKELIPLRPEGYSVTGLTQEEQTALTWLIVSGCPRKDAVLTFVRPDMLDSKAKAAVEDYIRQFFARREVRDYMEAYQKTIQDFLNPAKEIKPFEPDKPLEERKALSKQKLIEFTMSVVENIDKAKDPEAVMKMADKVGLMDANEDAPEEPRRYLPVRCGSCAYRQFCEENAEDMCPHCKYMQKCEEHGIHFDKQDMLDISIQTEDEK